MKGWRSILTKLLFVVGPKDGRRFVGLYLVLLMMAAVEAVGIASVLPFMKLATSPETASDLHWLREAADAVGINEHASMIAAAGAVLLVLLTLSNGFAVLGLWLQHRYASRLDHRISVRLLDSYAHRGYQYFLDHNSADLGKQVLSEVNQLILGFLLPLVTMFSTSTVAIVILGMLFVVEPLATTFAVLGLGGTYATIYFLVRKRLDRLGAARIESLGVRFRAAAELLSGIKAVKIFGAEREFIDRFTGGSRAYTSVQVSMAVLSAAPRYAVETFIFVGATAVLITATVLNVSMSNVIPLLSLYGLAGYRLLPQLQKLYQSIATMRFSLPSLETIYRDFAEAHVPNQIAPAVPEAKELSLENQIRFENVSFRYAGAEKDVLQHISLTIPKSSSTAFVGETGCGKTTLVDILTGLLEPTEGSVLIDGVPLTSEGIDSWRAMIGYVPQEVFLFDDTVARNIAFAVGSTELDLARVRWAASVAQVGHFIANELSDGYHTNIGERGVRLSGGQRQRLGLARALYRDPRVLILDEGTSALDSITEAAVLNAIRASCGNVTLICVAHRLSTVKDCDQLCLLEEGRIAGIGSLAELMSDSRRFQDMVTVTS